MWVSVMFVLFVAVSAAPDAHSRDVSLARRNLTNCFPFSHVRKAPENACMSGEGGRRGRAGTGGA